jgi:hypothetical protein
MSDDWDSGGSGAKKGVPKWIWFCGGGCLLMILFLVVVAIFAVGWVRDGADKEKQWPNVEHVLHYDERHPGYELVWGQRIPFVGVEIYTFTQNEAAIPEGAARLTAVLMKFPAGAADEAAQMLDAEQQEQGEVSEVVVNVQGRDLEGLRLTNQGGGSPFPGGPKQESGATLMVALHESGATEPVVLMLIRANSTTEVSDDDLVQFLDPFHVGPDR